MLSPYLECGKIINTHGCRGELKVDPWTDSPEAFTDLPRVFLDQNGSMREMSVTRASVLQGRFILLGLDGVKDMDDADALRGSVLYAAREDFHLSDGRYFLSDVLGCEVRDAREGQGDAVLGKIEDILPGAAASIYAIRTSDRKQVLVPAVPAFVKEVIPGELVRIAPIDGMFTEPEAIMGE